MIIYIVKSKRKMSVMKRFVVLSVALLCILPLWAEREKPIKGYTGLYMGHSFFRPSVNQLAKIMPGSESKRVA